MFVHAFESLGLPFGWAWFVGTVASILVLTVGLLLTVAYVLLADRKIFAAVQMRRGPNVVGAFGLLQSFADFFKFAFKEVVIPSSANKGLFLFAPLLTFTLAFIAFAVVPVAHGWVISDINVGILYLFAISSLGVYGVIVGGWASNSKYPFLSAMRSAAQMVSYEVSIGFVLVTVMLFAGSLNLTKIVEAQRHGWFAFTILFPMFIVFFVSAIAETNRPPFDLVEAESELVGGFHTEYSGARFMLFYLAEYINTITICALTVTLFLGGFNGPVPFGPAALWGFIWFLVKTIVLVVVFFWIRVTLPRLRYDQLMQFGWKMIIPANLVYLMLVAVYVAFAARGDLPQYWSGG